MGVSSFHDRVVRPMLAAHISERIELAKIVRNVALIRLAGQQAVDDGDDLSSGDVAVCAEGTILVVIDTKCACWLCYFAACAWGVDSYLVSMTSTVYTK